MARRSFHPSFRFVASGLSRGMFVEHFVGRASWQVSPDFLPNVSPEWADSLTGRTSGGRRTDSLAELALATRWTGRRAFRGKERGS